jgi:hypothetical protein
MTKLKGAAILGALLFSATVLLPSFPAFSAKSFLPVSTKQLVKTCSHLVAPEDADETLGPTACKIFGSVADRLGPYITTASNPEPPPVTQDVLAKVARKFRGSVKRFLRQDCCDQLCDPFNGCPEPQEPGPCNTPCDVYRGQRCDGCVAGISDLEAYMATNGTAQFLADQMDDACTGRFPTPELEADCVQRVDGYIPPAIDLILANLPPQTLCQAIRYCPE